jgi:hypothetical protein
LKVNKTVKILTVLTVLMLSAVSFASALTWYYSPVLTGVVVDNTPHAVLNALPVLNLGSTVTITGTVTEGGAVKSGLIMYLFVNNTGLPTSSTSDASGDFSFSYTVTGAANDQLNFKAGVQA